MCVAICCPKGVNTPSLETLKKCWDHNSHGAGFAYNDPHTNKVYFHKGFMKWEDFVHAFQKVCKVDAMTDNVRFIHFRITSKGETCPENTHPFPISSVVNDLKILDGVCDEIMFHNGTFSSIDISEKGISDTMEMAMWVSRLNLTSQGLDALCKFLTPLISSNKLGFLNGKGEYALAGSWSEIDGVFYSNTYWNYTAKSYSTNNKYNYQYNSVYSYYDDYGSSYEYDYNTKTWNKKKQESKKNLKTNEIVIGAEEVENKKYYEVMVSSEDKRVYYIVTDTSRQFDMIDGWCPECSSKYHSVDYVGMYTKDKSNDPIFKCPDCNKYFILPFSSMSQKELADFIEYIRYYYQYDGKLSDFFEDYFGATVETTATPVEETVEVVDDKKEESKSITLPVTTAIAKVVKTIKEKAIVK